MVEQNDKNRKHFNILLIIFSNMKPKNSYNIVFYSFMKLSIVTFMELRDEEDEIF